MKPDPREEEIVAGALELPDDATRAAFLNDACEGDAALQARIKALLAARIRDGALLSTPTVVTPPDKTVKSGTPAEATAGDKVRYFGDYELIEEIARGGMGVVWKARQVSLNRIVALKMILAGKFAGEDEVKRFRLEAEAAANLQHPNIVAIHEVGEHQGQHYFSMDYVEGQNLAELVRKAPLPATKAAQYIKNIAEAVQYAHQRGILHRDLKPSNVLVDTEGRVRITDFGLAKRMQMDSGLTQTGAVLGTPAYMAPEQVRHPDQVGPATDVYALGTILYELLARRAPFSGKTPVETMHKVLSDEPEKPSKLNSNIPPDLETICLKCLEKQPERRYATARNLAEDIERFLNGDPVFARPASVARKSWIWLQRHPWLIAGSASLLVVVALVLAYGLYEKLRLQTLQTKEKELSEVRTILQTADRKYRADLFERGMKKLLETATQFPEWRVKDLRIHQMLAARGPAQRISHTHDNGERVKIASQDGRYVVATFINGVLEVFRVSDGASVFTSGGLATSNAVVACSHDGQWVALADLSRSSGEVKLWKWSEKREPAVLKPHLGGVTAVTFSPDGKHLATAGQAEKTPGLQPEIRIWDLETLALKHVIPCFKNASRTATRNQGVRETLGGSQNYVSDLQFNPDGSLLAVTSAIGLTRILLLTGLSVMDADADALALGGVWPTGSICFSPNGKEFSWTTNNYPTHVYTTSLDGLATRLLFTNRSHVTIFLGGSHGPRLLGELCYSHDGRHLIGEDVAFELNGSGKTMLLPQPMSQTTAQGHWLAKYLRAGEILLWRVEEFEEAAKRAATLPQPSVWHRALYPEDLIINSWYLASFAVIMVLAFSMDSYRSWTQLRSSQPSRLFTIGFAGVAIIPIAQAMHMVVYAVHDTVWQDWKLGMSVILIGLAWIALTASFAILWQQADDFRHKSLEQWQQVDPTPLALLVGMLIGYALMGAGLLVAADHNPFAVQSVTTGTLIGFLGLCWVASASKRWKACLGLFFLVSLTVGLIGAAFCPRAEELVLFGLGYFYGLNFGAILALTLFKRVRQREHESRLYLRLRLLEFLKR
jgi:serine/threonine protein kinase